MSDEPDNIELDESEEGAAPEASGGKKGGKFLSPFIIKMLTFAIGGILVTIWIVILFMVLIRCTSSPQPTSSNVPQTQQITRQAVEHLEYHNIEDAFRQRLIDDSMVQIKISLGFKEGNKKIGQELSSANAEIRDVIIKQLSHMKGEDFKKPNALDELEEALVKQINRLLNTGKIERVFFQEYTLM
ncbi:MAG: flagellar basal body-associated FliL family protein [Spirochaetes bacterium]|jgi:flagellar basal body-associated protein FliL|nr:flagellar basal body-associated FliL family protein [Spirochaetota bacterium]